MTRMTQKEIREEYGDELCPAVDIYLAYEDGSVSDGHDFVPNRENHTVTCLLCDRTYPTSKCSVCGYEWEDMAQYTECLTWCRDCWELPEELGGPGEDEPITE